MTLVHEVRTATEEEIAVAALEVPELLRRAQVIRPLMSRD